MGQGPGGTAGLREKDGSSLELQLGGCQCSASHSRARSRPAVETSQLKTALEDNLQLTRDNYLLNLG